MDLDYACGLRCSLSRLCSLIQVTMQLFIVSSLLFSIIVTTLAAPVTYDQRQDGKVNVHAKLENFLIVVAPSSAAESSSDSSGIDFIVPGVLEALEFRKNLIAKEDSVKNEKKRLQEENTESESREIEQLLEESRTLKIEKTKKKPIDRNTESKLIGDGIENCGPGRRRDSFGICQSDSSFKL